MQVSRRDAPRDRNRRLTAISLIATLLGIGCASPDFPRPPIADPAQIDGQVPYRIRVGDSLEVRFYKTPELNLEVPVRNDGKVSLELVGDVQAAGLTTDELSRTLTKAYGKELNDPRVTVVLRQFGGQVFVQGEVKAPGGPPFAHGLTAMQAISLAGGFTDDARPSTVILIRRESGKFKGYKLALSRVLSGEDITEDVMLETNDIIYVPKSPIAKVDLWVDQYIRRLLPVNPATAALGGL